MQDIACEVHPNPDTPVGAPKPWIVCVHVCDAPAAAAKARRTVDRHLAGEVLCEECNRLLDATGSSSKAVESLRLACESCVLERWAHLLVS